MKPATALFWIAVTFTLAMALLPNPAPVIEGVNDKVQHMVAFATLALIALMAFGGLRYRFIFLGLAGFGAAIEVLQMIPALHRDAEFTDWLADCVAILGVLGVFRVARWMAVRVSD